MQQRQPSRHEWTRPMTTSNSTLIQGRRRERRLIPPFGDGSNPNRLSNQLDHALASCRFAPFAHVALISESAYYLEPGDVERPVEPRIEIVVDEVDPLSDALGCRQDELIVGLSVTSRHLKRYEVVHEWELADLPVTWSPGPGRLDKFQTQRGLDLVLSLRVASNRRALRQQGLGLGKVLCRREFSIRESVDTSAFPFEWREFGGETAYPDELLWTIKWHDIGEDDDQYDRPVAEVLTVWGNRKAEERLIAIDRTPGAEGLAWRMMAADITTQIWADVLRGIEIEPNEDDGDTLAGQVFRNLSRVSGKTYGEVKELAQQDDSLTELRGLVAKALRVVR